MNLNEALEKIKRLIALSTSSNQHEAANAAAAAARIAEQHRIDQATIEAALKETKKNIRIDQDPIYKFKKEVVWKSNLLTILCSFYGCYRYRNTYAHGPVKRTRNVKIKDEFGDQWWAERNVYAWTEYGFCIVGEESDIQIVRFMFGWLSIELTRLSVLECKGQGKSYSTSWLIGAVDGIQHQLNSLKEKMRAEAKANEQSAAIVLLDSRFAEAKQFAESSLTLSPIKKNYEPKLTDSAYYRGREKGKTIHLGKSMPAAHKALPGKS